MIPQQAHDVAARVAELLGDDLVGIYLHGSFALGCGNPNRSDLDLLVVTRRALTAAERDAFAVLPQGKLDLPGWPRPLELSSLTLDQVHPWRHPLPRLPRLRNRRPPRLPYLQQLCLQQRCPQQQKLPQKSR